MNRRTRKKMEEAPEAGSEDSKEKERKKKEKERVGETRDRAESGNVEIFGALPTRGYLIMIKRN